MIFCMVLALFIQGLTALCKDISRPVYYGKMTGYDGKGNMYIFIHHPEYKSNGAFIESLWKQDKIVRCDKPLLFWGIEHEVYIY